MKLIQRFPVFSSLQSRFFTLFWSGQSISQVGDGAFTIALIWQTIALTHSAISLGEVVIAEMLPFLLILLLGGLAADHSPIILMIGSDFLRGAIMLLLACLTMFHLLQFWQLLACSLFFGFVRGFFQPAYESSLPRWVSDDWLPSANALSQASIQIGLVLGPLVGGALLARASIASVYLFDGLTFVLSALCLLIAKSHYHMVKELDLDVSQDKHFPRVENTPRSIQQKAQLVFNDLRAPLTYVFSTPWLILSLVISALFNTSMGSILTIALPVLALSRGVRVYSLLQTLFAIGNIGGILCTGSRTIRHRGIIFYLVLAVAGCLIILLGIHPASSVFLLQTSAILLLIGIGVGGANVFWQVILQTHTSPELLGRITSLDLLISYSLAPLGIAAAGVAISHVGISLFFFILGTLCALLGVIALTHRTIRRL